MMSPITGLSVGHVPVVLVVILLVLPIWATKWSLPIMLLFASPAWLWLLTGLFAGGVLSGSWIAACVGAGSGVLVYFFVEMTGLRQHVLARGNKGGPPRWRVWVCTVVGECAGWWLSVAIGADVSPGKTAVCISGGALLGCIVGVLAGPTNERDSARRPGKTGGRRQTKPPVK